MGGFVLAGLTGPLVTVGLGREVVVIIQEQKPSGGAIYWKKRVQALSRSQQNKVQILRTVTAQSEIPINILVPQGLEKEYRLNIMERIKKWRYQTARIKVSLLIMKSSTKVVLKEWYIAESESPIIILAGRILTLIDKAVRIHSRSDIKSKTEAKLISTEDILSDVEKAEITDIIEDLEDLDDESS